MALQWLKNFKALDTIDKNKSYARLCCVICTKKLKNLGKFGKPPQDTICYIQALLMLTMASLAKNLGTDVKKQTLKSHIKSKCYLRMAKIMKIATKLGKGQCDRGHRDYKAIAINQ